jgi:hypothetical protein
VTSRPRNSRSLLVSLLAGVLASGCASSSRTPASQLLAKVRHPRAFGPAVRPRHPLGWFPHLANLAPGGTLLDRRIQPIQPTQTLEVGGRTWYYSREVLLDHEQPARPDNPNLLLPELRDHEVVWIANQPIIEGQTRFVKSIESVAQGVTLYEHATLDPVAGIHPEGLGISGAPFRPRSWKEALQVPVLRDIYHVTRYVMGLQSYTPQRLQERLERELDFALSGASYMFLTRGAEGQKMAFRIIPGNEIGARHGPVSIAGVDTRDPETVIRLEVEREFPKLELPERQAKIPVYELGRLGKSATSGDDPLTSDALDYFYREAARYLYLDLPRRARDGRGLLSSGRADQGSIVHGAIYASASPAVLRLHMAKYGKTDARGKPLRDHGWEIVLHPEALRLQGGAPEPVPGEPTDEISLIKISTQDFFRLHPPGIAGE